MSPKKAKDTLWGTHKITWLSTLTGQLILHPLAAIVVVTPVVIHPSWWAMAISGALVGVYHEWTQFYSNRKPHLLERLIDVLGHAVIPAGLWTILERFTGIL